MCHFASPFLQQEGCQDQPYSPTLCCHHPPLTHLSELWLQEAAWKSRETWNWRGAEGWWWSRRTPRGKERQGRTPAQLSWREQGWAVKEVVLVAATGNGVQHPKWQHGVKSKGSQASAQQSSCTVRHRHPGFQGLVCHCSLLSWAQGWEKVVAGSSLHPVFDPGTTACRESLPSCLCPRNHAELHWGGKHLLWVKILYFFYCIVAVTVLIFIPLFFALRKVKKGKK